VVSIRSHGRAQVDAAELNAVLLALRRALRQRLRSTSDEAPLSPSQVELVRLVRERPGVGVAEAAARLQLAPNTVSTLVSELVALGLIERRRDPADGRAAQLSVTVAAEERFARWVDRLEQVMQDALEQLDPRHTEALAGAMPALRRLLEQVGEVE
jgi:DNA-binding MarR family transcriptional regulator